VTYALLAVLIAPGALFAAEEDKGVAMPEQPTVGAPPVDPAIGAVEEAPAVAVPAPAAERPAPDAESEPQPRQARAEAAPEPVARAAAPGSVTIKDFSFEPSSITVNVGETVTWTNVGPTEHSATADDGSFDTGVYPKGESRSHTFQSAGTFAYHCTPHPFMKGTVRVVAAGGEQPSEEDGSGSGAPADSDDTAGSQGAGSRDDGAALPATGADVGVLAGLGLGMLALGALIRRRAGRSPA
jgi:LPXTG-motif cell wall-anchored protein